MTVSSTDSRVPYSGDGSTVSFPIPFNFTSNADIVAVLADVDGVETTWTITTDYTLTGAGGTSGGTLTAVTAPATGEKLVIYRDPEIKQLVDYVENDPFASDTHEGALDKLTHICQALDEKIGRALLQPVTSSSSNVTFATPDAGKVLLWNATGTAVTNGPDADQITSAQGYATAAAASAAAAAASAATVPDFPAITGEGGKYVKINAGGTAFEYDALGTAAQVDLASQAEAEAGIENAKAVTPLGVAQRITAILASQAEAEAGIDTSKLMTPQRVAQAIAALAPDGGGVGTTINTSRAMTAATGSVDYNTSESTKTPKAAFIFYRYDANNWGWSYADGASGFLYGKLTGAEYFQWDAYVISAQPYAGDLQGVAASGVSFSAGKVTLSWVKVGSPAGTLYLKIVPLY